MRITISPIAKVSKWLCLLVALASPSVFAETTQQHIHEMSHHVMPFAMSETTHVFTMTEQGGVMSVIAKDASASDQVSLIQRHLTHQAKLFSQGDYSAPASLHGDTMPGLKTLQQRASELRVLYTATPEGANIEFKTTDLTLITAIHRWFGAQLSEHGADARAE
ncbi:hypothetical protein ACVFI8_00270 [Agarivorans sp. MS3-6]|uniref:hypothetical protein n=1 Tax=Agarivorans sp. TSD2052 TaxID=2937286 RepID=UPI00200DEDFB|nr:hypothetical protein [Agarivorans sp. TSD2052]UPW20517.1 hypothetical protein M0C34_09770 [Agarivorans sp. TSD2052]